MMQLFEKNDPGMQRDTEKKCTICAKQFKISRKEHQCKKCYRAVCSDCGKERTLVFKQGFLQEPHRNCKLCVQETKGLKDYINFNKIAFGNMSVLGEKWLKKIQNSNELPKSQFKKSSIFNREMFNMMWDSYNYSMREFIGLLTFSSSQEDVYGLVVNVFSNMQSVFPNQNIQTMAYLSIFLLCFCNADKASVLGLYLLQLKNMVTDSEGLLQAYLKALGLGQEDKIRSYVKFIGNKFVSSFSINIAHISSSIYLIEKVITRKKIDELYIFFTLSLDVIKEQIVKEKYSNKYHNLLFVRLCTPNSTSGKYRQAASVKSSFFIKQMMQEQDIMNYTIAQDDTRSTHSAKQHNVTHINNRSYQAPRFNKKNTKYSEFEINQPANNFEEDKQSSHDDSLSMLSMIQELKDLQKPPEKEELYLAGLDGPSKRDSGQSGKEAKMFGGFSQPSGVVSPIRLPPDQNELKSFSLCEGCENYQIEIAFLKKQLQQYSKIKQQNEQLKDKLRKYERQNTFNREATAMQNMIMMEKSELEVQIKKLKLSITQYQSRQKEYQLATNKITDLNKQVKRLQLEIRTLQAQLEESLSTNKMLANRLQNQSLQTISIKQPQPQPTGSVNPQSKIVELLKQNIKQKNSQIEELTKKNKLMAYQIEEASRSGRDGKEQAALKQKIQKMQAQRESFLVKIGEMSGRFLQEQSEKLRLSEQNFIMREILSENGLKYQ